MYINRWLRERRLELGMSQAEVAQKAGISQAHLSSIERGADLQLSTLLEIARALQAEPLMVKKEFVPAVTGLMAGTNTSIPLMGADPEDREDREDDEGEEED